MAELRMGPRPTLCVLAAVEDLNCTEPKVAELLLLQPLIQRESMDLSPQLAQLVAAQATPPVTAAEVAEAVDPLSSLPPLF